MTDSKIKLIKYSVLAGLTIILLMLVNPFGYNNMGYRQVIESPFGTKSIVFGNGMYLKVPGSTVTTYPNLVTIAYTKQVTEATVNQGLVEMRFMDATVAQTEIFVKYALPNGEDQMDFR